MYWVVGRPTMGAQENAPLTLEVGGHFIADGNYCTDRQNSDNYLLLYTMDGMGSLQYDGKTYILDAGKLFLIDCNRHQIYRTQGERWEFLWVHFRALGDGWYVNTLIQRAGPVFDCTADGMEERFWGMLRLLEHGAPNLVHDGFYRLAEILTLLYQQTEYVAHQPNVSPETARILTVIEQQFAQPLRLDNLASLVNRSKYYLCHNFKREMGISIYAYLTLFRMTRAQMLLRTTNLPVQDIANQVGFDSVSNFIHTFAQSVGCTPARYRKQWQ